MGYVTFTVTWVYRKLFSHQVQKISCQYL